MPKQKENLNLFGEWIDTFSKVLHIYWEDISRRIQIDRSTIPQLAHGTKSPKRQTIESIWRAVQSIAEERGVHFAANIETAFLNAAGHSTAIQIETSAMVLNALRVQYGLPALDANQDHIFEMSREATSQEVDRLRHELRRKEERIVELEVELRKWRP